MPRRRQSPGVPAYTHRHTAASSLTHIHRHPAHKSSEPHKIRGLSPRGGGGRGEEGAHAGRRQGDAGTHQRYRNASHGFLVVGWGWVGYDEEESERRNASSCRRIDPSAGESTHTRRRGGEARGLMCVMRSSPHRVAQRPRRAFICYASTVDRGLARARPQSFFWSSVRSSRAARLLLLAAAVGLALTKGHARNRRTRLAVQVHPSPKTVIEKAAACPSMTHANPKKSIIAGGRRWRVRASVPPSSRLDLAL